MIVVFDASLLVYLFDKEANPPKDPVTGKPVERCAERIRYLIKMLQQQGDRIVIPTPSLAEVLVRAEAGASGRLRILKSSRHFRIVPFDDRAAVEYAAAQGKRRRAGTKSPAVTRAKAKFDDQIVAIAVVESAGVIYSDDDDIKKLVAAPMEVIGIADLPLPPEDPQGALELDVPPEDQE